MQPNPSRVPTCRAHSHLPRVFPPRPRHHPDHQWFALQRHRPHHQERQHHPHQTRHQTCTSQDKLPPPAHPCEEDASHRPCEHAKAGILFMPEVGIISGRDSNCLASLPACQLASLPTCRLACEVRIACGRRYTGSLGRKKALRSRESHGIAQPHGVFAQAHRIVQPHGVSDSRSERPLHMGSSTTKHAKPRRHRQPNISP